MFTIGISNGIRGPEILRAECPDMLLENANDLMRKEIMGILKGNDDR